MCMFYIGKAVRFSLVIRTAKGFRSMVIFIFISTFVTKTKNKYTPATNLAGITTEINWKNIPVLKLKDVIIRSPKLCASGFGSVLVHDAQVRHCDGRHQTAVIVQAKN